MGMPTDVGVIDLMMGTQAGVAAAGQYEFMRRGLRDSESPSMHFPAQYMFKDVPFSDQARGAGPSTEEPPQGADLLLPEMDKYGIEKAMIGVSAKNQVAQAALRDHPDRFIASYEINPNKGMDGVRDLVDMYETWGVKAATVFPAGLMPQVPIDDKRLYIFYAKCIELDIPIVVNGGVPGPRLPMACQDVALFDEVCWFFPELRIIIRHGGEPWEELAVKLMLKWPGLHYMTSAFAPKYYPKAIIDFANTRGSDKIMYAGYFPMGLSLERIFSELPNVPFRDEVWPKFLRHNAVRVLKLDDA